MVVCSSSACSAPAALHNKQASIVTHRRINQRAAVVAAAAPSQAAAAGAAAADLPSSRRGLLAGAAALLAAAAVAPQAQAVPVPPAPRVGDCPDCIGVVNETLNTCTLDSASCISTLNDDEAHFAAPWQFDGDREAAVAQLVDVVSGGAFDAGLIDTFGGISQVDAAKYIAGGVLAVATGGDLPEQPKRKRKTEFTPFDGQVVERTTTAGGAEYVRVLLGGGTGGTGEVEDASAVIDAEFLFLPGDNIVNVRAASRAEPEGGLGPGGGGRLALSFTSGLTVDRNVARRRLESLRTALRWEPAIVLADFDPQFCTVLPKFNGEAPTIFDKVFDPFNRRNAFQPSGIPYPAEGGR